MREAARKMGKTIKAAGTHVGSEGGGFRALSTTPIPSRMPFHGQFFALGRSWTTILCNMATEAVVVSWRPRPHVPSICSCHHGVIPSL